MKINQDAVIVSVKVLDTDDPYDIILSNSQFVQALLAAGVLMEDVTACALRSHFVDVYRGEVQNGGFSQFVYNTRWDEEVITLIREGLATMGATQNLNAFNKAAAVVEAWPAERLRQFLDEDYFDPKQQDGNPPRDDLSQFDPLLCETIESEDLIQLHSTWLHNHPDLVTLDRDQATAEIKRRAAM